MKRFGVLAVGLVLIGGLTTAGADTRPPKNLKLVGDHWTPWDPPQPGPDAYIIQRGDTLWDLAGKWFGDPFLWPQVWDQNRYILDSHWIYPGDPLVVPGKPTVVPEGGPPPVAESTPPPRATPPPVETAPTPPPLRAIASETDLYCVGLISRDATPAALWIAAKETDGELLGEGHVVFLNQGRDHGLRAGDMFQVQRRAGPVVHPASGAEIGTLVRRMGRVRVLIAHETTATAVIDMSCEDIAMHDELVPWQEIPSPMLAELPVFDRLDPTSSGGATGQIVLARDRLHAVAEGSVIFTDLGTAAGVAPGDVLLLFRDRANGLPRQVLGQAVVLTVEGESSTAKIVASARESMIGDRVEVWR